MSAHELLALEIEAEARAYRSLETIRCLVDEYGPGDLRTVFARRDAASALKHYRFRRDRVIELRTRCKSPQA